MKSKVFFRKLDLNLTGIILLASFLRFYNYQNRWALAYDQAWFAVIARYALSIYHLPLLGPFASGGPFQTGGEWFWIVMIGTLLNPFSVISPWIFITLLSILQVFLMFVVGKEIVNKNFGYLSAFLCAISTSQILQSTNLTSQMTESLFATLLIFSMVRFIKSEKMRYLFMIGFSVGLASAVHLQGVLLLPVVLIILLLTKTFRVRKLAIVLLGLFIPWAPVLLVDIGNHFFNTKNMLLYLVHPQAQASYEVLGRRWLSFVFSYIPFSWGRIVGGNIAIGFIEVLLAVMTFIILLYKKKIEKIWIVLFFSVGIIMIILRYVRVPLFENYITFLHPFVLLIIAFSIWNIMKKTKYLGYLFIIIIFVFSTKTTLGDVLKSTNTSAVYSKLYMNILKKSYPNEKFAMYDYNYKSTVQTLPLVLYLQTSGLIDDKSRKIGAIIATSEATIFQNHKIIYGKIGNYQLVDLSSSTSAQLKKSGWIFVNPSRIYNSVENWYKSQE